MPKTNEFNDKEGEIMTKTEFIKAIQAKTNIEIPQKDIAEILNAIENVVKDAVIDGDEVTIPGICKVKTKDVPERTGKIILGDKAGETWIKPAHKEATVKVVPSLKKIFD